MLTVTMLVGLPGSGKSTYAKKLIEDHPGMYKRVNKDDLRNMLDAGKYSKSNEQFILDVQDMFILKALEEGKHVIVDNTHLSDKHENRIAALVKGKAQLIINDSFLQVPLEECIRRDLLRSHSVGETVIRQMYNQFLKPSIQLVEYNMNLPDCIIVDLDGTVALLNGRNPYDASTCENDIPNKPIIDIVRKYNNENCHHIIFVSGRQDKWREQSIRWIRKNVEIVVFDLYMRQTGDERKDSIVKKEIYDLYIKDKYNVFFVLDDRNQVVRTWRDLGLTVLQVADGDF